MARPGPGNGWRPTISSGRPSSRPTCRTSSLNSSRERLQQLERQSLGQTAHVVVGLDRDRRAAQGRKRLDDVGIESALHQEPDVLPHLLGLGLEHVDEGVADATPLLLGVGDAGEPLQKTVAGIHHPEVDAEVAAERLLYLVPLVEPQESVVHEDAGQPLAHRTVHQHRRHRGVHAAREAADHPLLGPDHLPDAGDLGLDEVSRRPVGRATADLEEEVVEDLAAPRRVGDLGMELHAEERPLLCSKAAMGEFALDAVTW